METEVKETISRKQGSSGAALSPCAACKLLRRRCVQDCIFAPYFPADEPQKFATVHKVFGASNVSKLLQVSSYILFFLGQAQKRRTSKKQDQAESPGGTELSCVAAFELVVACLTGELNWVAASEIRERREAALERRTVLLCGEK